MSAGRKARRLLDQQLRREGKPRALFRVSMRKDGLIAESVAIEQQDKRAMIRSVEALLAQLKSTPAPALQPPVQTPAPVFGVKTEGARTGWSPSTPQIAAVKYFGRKEVKA